MRSRSPKRNYASEHKFGPSSFHHVNTHLSSLLHRMLTQRTKGWRGRDYRDAGMGLWEVSDTLYSQPRVQAKAKLQFLEKISSDRKTFFTFWIIALVFLKFHLIRLLSKFLGSLWRLLYEDLPNLSVLLIKRRFLLGSSVSFFTLTHSYCIRVEKNFGQGPIILQLDALVSLMFHSSTAR